MAVAILRSGRTYDELFERLQPVAPEFVDFLADGLWRSGGSPFARRSTCAGSHPVGWAIVGASAFNDGFAGISLRPVVGSSWGPALRCFYCGRQQPSTKMRGGYVEFMQRTHPDAPLPPVYVADGVLEDEREKREQLGDEMFFRVLSEDWVRLGCRRRRRGTTASRSSGPRRRAGPG